MHLLRRVVSELLDLLAPPGCLACDHACDAGASWCAQCGCPVTYDGATELDGVPLLALGPYRPPLSTAIVRFKYEGRAELSQPLSSLLLPALGSLALPADAALVPVPMHPKRLAARGYNQAALLARELARRARRPCRPLLLRRTREAERQVGQSRSGRLENALGAFDLRRPGPESVVLVDDVITTGATVRACAQALAAGGVRLAAVVTLARAEHG